MFSDLCMCTVLVNVGSPRKGKPKKGGKGPRPVDETSPKKGRPVEEAPIKPTKAKNRNEGYGPGYDLDYLDFPEGDPQNAREIPVQAYTPSPEPVDAETLIPVKIKSPGSPRGSNHGNWCIQQRWFPWRLVLNFSNPIALEVPCTKEFGESWGRQYPWMGHIYVGSGGQAQNHGLV